MTNYTKLISTQLQRTCSQHEPFFYLLLLHELRVGAVVNNVATKDRGGERRVNLFSANVAKLAIQDKVITFGAEIDRSLLAEENEGENVAILPALVLERAPKEFPGEEGMGRHTFARASKKNL